MKFYNKYCDCDVIPDKNAVSLGSLCNKNLSLNDDGDDHNYDEVLAVADVKHDEALNFIFLISQVLLELREKLNVRTEVIRFVSEKIVNKN